MDYLWAVLLVLSALACWMLNVLAVPGSNWLMIVLSVLYVWQGPDEGRLALTWAAIGYLVVLAALGELVEFLAGAAGVQNAGGSRRSAALAILGSIFGGLMGALITFPVPILGPLVGAILLAGVGALGGALLGEWWKGRQWEQSWEVGKAAFWGRLFGTFGKILFGSVMVVVILTGVAW